LLLLLLLLALLQLLLQEQQVRLLLPNLLGLNSSSCRSSRQSSRVHVVAQQRVQQCLSCICSRSLLLHGCKSGCCSCCMRCTSRVCCCHACSTCIDEATNVACASAAFQTMGCVLKQLSIGDRSSSVVASSTNSGSSSCGWINRELVKAGGHTSRPLHELQPLQGRQQQLLLLLLTPLRLLLLLLLLLCQLL
jgi:hypothetical protein